MMCSFLDVGLSDCLVLQLGQPNDSVSGDEAKTKFDQRTDVEITQS
jgi:hypothetical protein